MSLVKNNYTKEGEKMLKEKIETLLVKKERRK